MVDRRWKIHFHKRCGRYITFLDDYQRARRENDTYDHGLVFSNRPLRLGELFQLKLEETESKWAGSLVKICSLTSNDIGTVNAARQAIRYVIAICPMFSLTA